MVLSALRNRGAGGGSSGRPLRRGRRPLLILALMVAAALYLMALRQFMISQNSSNATTGSAIADGPTTKSDESTASNDETGMPKPTAAATTALHDENVIQKDQNPASRVAQNPNDQEEILNERGRTATNQRQEDQATTPLQAKDEQKMAAVRSTPPTSTTANQDGSNPSSPEEAASTNSQHSTGETSKGEGKHPAEVDEVKQPRGGRTTPGGPKGQRQRAAAPHHRSPPPLKNLECVYFQQTDRCDPNGAPVRHGLRTCDTMIARGLSGHCLCNGVGALERNTYIVAKSSCNHRPFTCAEACRQGEAFSAEDDAMMKADGENVETDGGLPPPKAIDGDAHDADNGEVGGGNGQGETQQRRSQRKGQEKNPRSTGASSSAADELGEVDDAEAEDDMGAGGGCVAFRATLGCNPDGKRDSSEKDLDCETPLSADHSGFCECSSRELNVPVKCVVKEKPQLKQKLIRRPSCRSQCLRQFRKAKAAQLVAHEALVRKQQQEAAQDKKGSKKMKDDDALVDPREQKGRQFAQGINARSQEEELRPVVDAEEMPDQSEDGLALVEGPSDHHKRSKKQKMKKHQMKRREGDDDVANLDDNNPRDPFQGAADRGERGETLKLDQVELEEERQQAEEGLD